MLAVMLIVKVSIPYRVHVITDLTRGCLLYRPSIADFWGFFKVFSVRPLFRKWLYGGLLGDLKDLKNRRTDFDPKTTPFDDQFPFDPSKLCSDKPCRTLHLSKTDVTYRPPP